jgi:hypothetical protein
VDGSTDGGFKSSTKQLMLLADLTPGPDPQLEKKLKLDLEMCRPGCRRLGWREREAG